MRPAVANHPTNSVSDWQRDQKMHAWLYLWYAVIIPSWPEGPSSGHDAAASLWWGSAVYICMRTCIWRACLIWDICIIFICHHAWLQPHACLGCRITDAWYPYMMHGSMHASLMQHICIYVWPHETCKTCIDHPSSILWPPIVAPTGWMVLDEMRGWGIMHISRSGLAPRHPLCLSGVGDIKVEEASILSRWFIILRSSSVPKLSSMATEQRNPHNPRPFVKYCTLQVSVSSSCYWISFESGFECRTLVRGILLHALWQVWTDWRDVGVMIVNVKHTLIHTLYIRMSVRMTMEFQLNWQLSGTVSFSQHNWSTPHLLLYVGICQSFICQPADKND